MFDSIVKNYINVAGISLDTSPKKFQHPITKQYGNLVSINSLTKNYGKEGFEFGDIANYISLDVSLEKTNPKIFNAFVKKFNSKISIIRWNIEGDKKLIDHFLIVANRFGSEEFIGKVHSFFGANLIEFIDNKFAEEPGSISYRIIPVYKDYSRGVAISTGEVI